MLPPSPSHQDEVTAMYSLSHNHSPQDSDTVMYSLPSYLSVVLFITPRERMMWRCVLAHNQIAEEAVIARKVDLHPLPPPGEGVEQHHAEEELAQHHHPL